MRNVMLIGLLGLTLVNPRRPVSPRAVGLPNLIVEIAVDSLKDVAVAVYTPWRGIIYYSPARHREMGPALSAYFRAHEFGHLYHHHIRGATLDAAELRGYELAADCYAARRLAVSDPAAVTAALAFFSRLGAAEQHPEHPTGAARAAMISECGA